MTYGRAVTGALAGGVALAVLLWWAGASVDALQLPGATGQFGIDGVRILGGWLGPWTYEVPAELGASGDPSDLERYRGLYETAMQIRYGVLFVCFLAGALFLIRRLPPVGARRIWMSFLAVWAWCLVSGTLAVSLSAPWAIAARGSGSYRFLPNLASSMASGHQLVVGAGLVAAAVTVIVAGLAARGAQPVPQNVVRTGAARLAASLGTAVIAVSLIVLSYQRVAAAIQEAGASAEAGDLARQLLLLGIWSAPSDGMSTTWLLYRAADALVLVVVWFALRLLPALLTRATFPALMAYGVCVTIFGLLCGQVVRAVVDGPDPYGGLNRWSGMGAGVPAAVVFGALAGAVATG
ncbi:hypothetical protein G6045_40295, partial [Streptomyces sp. YC504]